MNDLIGSAVVRCVLDDDVEVSAVAVGPGTAREAWRALRDRHAETGLWPFLVEAGRPTLLDRLPLAGTVREVHRGAAEIFALGAGAGRAGGPGADPVSAVAAGTTAVALVPAEWGGVEVPGLLGWDGAPGMSGLEHTAVLADWHRRFGAQLLTLTGDRVELHVPRPPVKDEDVAAVAAELAGYCPGGSARPDSALWCFQWD